MKYEDLSNGDGGIFEKVMDINNQWFVRVKIFPSDIESWFLK